jgi:amino acid transporter
VSVESTPTAEQRSELRANAIGLPGVLFQSVTTMAPAGAVAFSLGAAIAFTGGALPLAVIFGLIVCTLVALSIGSLAKHLPSAGGYFTYVSHSLGAESGWMTGWLYAFTYILTVPLTLLVLGPVTDSFLSGTFGLSLGPDGWLLYAAIFGIAMFFLTYFGIKLSADAGVILGAIEIAIFLILSIWLIVSAGSGNTFATFNPSSALEKGFFGGWQGILHGMIFTFLAFAGFDSAAPLAEESNNPRQTVSRAILLSVVCIGIFYLFCGYAGVVGWGFNHIGTYLNDPNPWGTMAKHVWGPFAFIAILAILNSGLANGNAGINAGSRVMYAMGRIRVIPALLGQTSRHRTPGIAIILTMVVGAIVTLGLGLIYGPTTAFALVGTLLTIPLLVVYMAVCVSVPLFYLREHRDEFNIVRHIIVPAIAFIVLAVVVYFQFVPAPPAPLNLAGPVCAVWFIIGLIVVIYLNRRAPKTLAESNRIFLSGGEDE